jgi:hypothetical protein
LHVVLNPIARRLQFESFVAFKLNPNERKPGFEGNSALKKYTMLIHDVAGKFAIYFPHHEDA